MTAVIHVQIACDFPDCDRAYNPDITAVNNVNLARRHSHAEGWKSTGPYGERRDYCPDHASLAGEAA